ncbi:hypothetical protein [Lacrimispora amygdalina]|uniref:hypothetical protein n=1 Tax=Lacrimispora amygdalina TaxID=253257 RepID=UPI000BE37F6B|nr:hypothetical protein [Lacrimispora amygdalina]
MSINASLEYSIVAFVDILGFSEMVRSDCENVISNARYFEVLKSVNEQTKTIRKCNITQFSDSVIFSLPLDVDNFYQMVEILTNYQKDLFLQSIICRGAISYGKHYKEEDFMFSQALIEAYKLESKEAIYPRIILSKNLFDYFKPQLNRGLPHLLCEQDGYQFIDYFSILDKEISKDILVDFNKTMEKYPLNVKEKYFWLFQYWEYRYSDKLAFSAPRFHTC